MIKNRNKQLSINFSVKLYRVICIGKVIMTFKGKGPDTYLVALNDMQF